MNTTPLTSRALGAALCLLGLAANAHAADVHLVARPLQKTMPDGRVVPMWGYALDADEDLSTDDGEPASAPGPRLALAPGDTTLTIHLRNDLPEPTSVMVSGQSGPLSPVWFTDAQGRQRVRSFMQETAPGAVGTYTFDALTAGTYLYQSATHPAVQVQMGLAGALTLDAAPGQAYSWGATVYQNEVCLVYSEVDPELHDAVAAGTYGQPPWESTVGYRPRYFLVNGEAYPQTPTLPIGVPMERTLLRFLNAGQESRNLVLRNSLIGLVAEQGRRRPNVTLHSTALVPAGSTVDAMTIVVDEGVTALYDRTLALSNADSGPGGMLIHLETSAAGAPGKLKKWLRFRRQVDKLAAKIGTLRLFEPANDKQAAKRDAKVAALQKKIAKWTDRIEQLGGSLGLESMESLDS